MYKETIIIVLVVLWTIPWKGVALWKSAQKKDLVWFIILLLVNTLSILEILYIFVFSKRKNLDSKINSPLPPKRDVRFLN